MSSSPLQIAIEKAGGKAALARALDISYQAINQWDRVPATRVLAVEAIVNGQVTRHQLRPDLYPEEHTNFGVAPVASRESAA